VNLVCLTDGGGLEEAGSPTSYLKGSLGYTDIPQENFLGLTKKIYKTLRGFFTGNQSKP
jgi:hypothetical protein